MNISYNEVLHYLGYKGQEADENTMGLIDDCIAELGSIVQKKYIYDFFDLTKKDEQIILPGSILAFPGRDIKRHLQYSVRCAVMAVTLGLEVDKRIAFYSKIDLSRGMVLDACASAAVEDLCDQVEDEIRIQVSCEGLYATSRYSPGYGDFPLEMQHKIIATLDTYRKIGLTVTESSLLVPRKSVTAVVGLQENPPDRNRVSTKCETCGNLDCVLRRDGKGCEKKN